MDYLRVGLVIAPQFLAGCLIYLLLLKRSEVDVIELASIGSVFGIVSSTIVDQIFVNLKLPHIGWLVAVLLAVAAFLQVRRSKKFNLPKVNWGSDFRKSVFAITAIAAMALGTEWFWLFPSGVLFVIASSFLIATQKKYSKIASGIANLCAVVAGIYMIANRPKIWWFLYDSDYAFLQALSRSLADWGLSDYLLLSGTDTKYHWFSYAWIGLVDRSSGASTFFVLTRIAPVLFVLLITCIIWKLINQFSTSILRTFASTLVIMTASSYSLWPRKLVMLASPSQVYGFAFLLTAIYLFKNENLFRFKYILYSIVASSVVLSKTMHGVTFLAIAVSVYLFQFFQTRKITKIFDLPFICSVLGVVAPYILFVSNSEASTVFEIRPGDFIWQLQGDGRSIPNKMVDLIGAISIAGFAAFPTLLTIPLFTSKTQLDRVNRATNLGVLATGMFLSLVILGSYGENLYFVHSAIVIASVFGFTSYSASQEKITNKFRTWVLMSALGIFACAITFFIPNINSGATGAVVLRSMRIFLVPSAFLTFGVFFAIFQIIRSNPVTLVLKKIVFVFSVMALCFTIKNWHENINDRHDEFRRVGLSYLGSLELRNIASWINQNSKENDIVASNFGWPVIKVNELALFSTPCTAVRNKDVPVETCRRTNNALLVAYMHRRTWLQATSIHYTGFTQEIDSRQTATLGFAADPTSANSQQMLDDGVDWFVVDRSTTNRTSWDPYATIEYTNDSFFALRLNKND